MGEVQDMTLQELRQMGLSESTAEWIKNLSMGICHEQVKERSAPTTANAVKTFKKLATYAQVLFHSL
jgi:hypothetical protein